MMTENRLRCGDFGGMTADGNPCQNPSVDGPCRVHANVDVEVSGPPAGFAFRVNPTQRVRDKVAIVGFTDHRVEALDLDDSWELWGLNELYRYMPTERFHRWFEIHGREYLEADDDGKKHMQDLKSLDIPIYMQKHHNDIPASVEFPVDSLVDALGLDYFTNCPAYMVGMAIAMGYKAIHVYGIDMAQDTEYAVQRPCVEWWLGVARGRGIDIRVPSTSDLLKSIGRYGYDDSGSALTRKLQERIKWLHKMDNERLNMLRSLEAEYQTKHKGLMAEIHRVEGALVEIGRQRKNATRDARIKDLEELKSSRENLVVALKNEYDQKHGHLTAERNQFLGGIQNSQYLLRSWLVPADNPKGGNIPDRSQDPRTGIVKAQSGDNVVQPELVGAA